MLGLLSDLVAVWGLVVEGCSGGAGFLTGHACMCAGLAAAARQQRPPAAAAAAAVLPWRRRPTGGAGWTSGWSRSSRPTSTATGSEWLLLWWIECLFEPHSRCTLHAQPAQPAVLYCQGCTSTASKSNGPMVTLHS